MSPSARLLLSVVAVSALTAIGNAQQPTPPQVVPHPRPDALSTLVGAIDTSITLGAWLKAHPAQEVGGDIPVSLADDVCRVTQRRQAMGGHWGMLRGLFNLPAPPSDEMLPADTARLAERVCQLRAFWFEVEEPDSARAQEIATVFSRLLQQKLGQSINNEATVGARGAGQWLQPRTWKGPGTTVVLGISPPEYHRTEEGTDTTRLIQARTVTVVAYAPNGGLDDVSSSDWDRSVAHLDEEEAWQKAWRFQTIDSAIARVRVAGIASDLQAVMRRVRAIGHLDSAPQGHAELVRAARAIREATRTLPPAQGATLLFAGDLVLTAAAGAFDPADISSSRYRLYKNLTAAGVRYGPEAYMVGYPYTRSWLWEAYGLDSLGQTGRAALIELLATGWKTTAGCEDNVDQIALVIEHGQAAMRRGEIDPMVQYYVGMAYQDRFSLARGDYYQGYADPRRYEAQAEEARVLGIERLRTSLLALKPRHLRRDAWRTGIRLMVGKPSQPRYFCFDD